MTQNHISAPSTEHCKAPLVWNIQSLLAYSGLLLLWHLPVHNTKCHGSVLCNLKKKCFPLFSIQLPGCALKHRTAGAQSGHHSWAASVFADTVEASALRRQPLLSEILLLGSGWPLLKGPWEGQGLKEKRKKRRQRTGCGVQKGTKGEKWGPQD